MLRAILRILRIHLQLARDRFDPGARRPCGRVLHLRQGLAGLCAARALRAADAEPHLFGRRRADGRVRARAPHLHADRRDSRPDQAGVHLGRGQELLQPRGLRPDGHRRGDLPGGAGRPAARRLDDHAAGDEELPADRRPVGRAQDQGDHPRDPARVHADQGQDPGALPERDLPRAEQLRRHCGGAGLLRQVARGADAGRGRLPGGVAAGSERAAPGAREAARDRAAELRAAADGRQRLRHPRGEPRGAGRGPADGPERRHRLGPAGDAAARLLHRRDPPPAVGEPRRRGAVHRRPDDPRHRGPRPAVGRGAGAARRAREVRPRPARLSRPGRAGRSRDLRPRDREQLAPSSFRDAGSARHRRLAAGGRAVDRRDLGADRHRGCARGRGRPLPELRRRALGAAA